MKLTPSKRHDSVVGYGRSFPSRMMGEPLVRPARNDRYVTLDLLRGVAAVFVLLFHLRELGVTAAPNGYLAVDFFFLLSGFVISASYERHLQSGMSTRRFFALRLVRLYPLYLTGLGLAFLTAVAQIALGWPHEFGIRSLVLSFGCEIFFLPSILSSFELFPLNGPAWSLFLELVVNLVYAKYLASASISVLKAIVAVAGVVLLGLAFYAGTLNLGWSWPTLGGGIARVFFGFPLGVILFRVGLGRSRFRTAWSLVPALAIVGVTVIPVAAPYRPAFDATVVFLLCPLLLISGVRWEVPPRFERIAKLLGDLSFPIYAIHIPIIFLVRYATGKSTLFPWVVQAIAIILIFLVAAASQRWLDGPIRRRLLALLEGKQVTHYRRLLRLA